MVIRFLYLGRFDRDRWFHLPVLYSIKHLLATGLNLDFTLIGRVDPKFDRIFKLELRLLGLNYDTIYKDSMALGDVFSEFDSKNTILINPSIEGFWGTTGLDFVLKGYGVVFYNVGFDAIAIDNNMFANDINSLIRILDGLIKDGNQIQRLKLLNKIYLDENLTTSESDILNLRSIYGI